VVQQLAPKGVLRAGINMSNFLLVNGKTEGGDPVGKGRQCILIGSTQRLPCFEQHRDLLASIGVRQKVKSIGRITLKQTQNETSLKRHEIVDRVIAGAVSQNVEFCPVALT